MINIKQKFANKLKVVIAGFGKAERENTHIQLDNPLSISYQYLRENKRIECGGENNHMTEHAIHIRRQACQP